ncbi:DUF4352 domain-containing protein [Micromonospora phytophila]|uniref:DUF4352 domain-containing protein n=1 Tax=Micromonospora phytophila TaxID=709888 RepID=UPI00202FA466|nr:DUF4352 domain-containing protein [Micromonospora phytophila]MCM0678285.1 DUF4352 domain-containing protein [Micromonospora phytophila]
MPRFPADQGGYPPQPPVSGAGQPPGDPWSPLPPVPQQPTAGDPWAAPQPPVSGAPQPPVSGAPGEPWAAPQPPSSGAPGQPWAAPQPPVSGAPGEPWAPPQQQVSGTPYPQVSGTPYAGMPGGPGYPLGAPQPVPSPNKKKTILIVAIVAAVLALLCCVGGIAAIVAGANKAADEVDKALPTPRVTVGVPGAPATSSPAENDGETFNMKPGDTLVLSDDDGTVEITVTKFTTATKGCKSYSPKPSKGVYLIANVSATVTKGKGSINPFYFEWVAADGTTVNGLASALSGCGDTLSSGNNLRVGSKRSGTVVFDVADKNGALEYQHKFETAGSWKP